MSDTIRIEQVIEEAYDTKTFVFQWDAEVRPGQFVMLWIPGVDEIPISVSGIDGDRTSVPVKNSGPATDAIHQLKPGDRMGIRGPFGHGFDLSYENMLIIGGGVGTAAIMPAVVQSGADVIIAARSDRDVILTERAEAASKNVWVATDDGSMGFHGNAVQLMREKLAEKKYDCILACGPEVMLYFTYKACEELGVKCQLSLERYMKCGAGVCGCCVMDDSRICRDGPVFTNEQIAQLKEFGVSKRDACGRTIVFRKA